MYSPHQSWFANYVKELKFKPLIFLWNHTVERIWVEVNGRVNYPIKTCLISMEENLQFNMDNSMHRFCVSGLALE